MRIMLGFALSPLASGVLQIFFMKGFRGFPIIMISYPLALVLGIPAFFAARHLGWLSLKAVLLGGAGLGFFAGCVLVALDGGYHEGPVWIVLGFAAMAAHGAVVAGLFWIIALSQSNRA
ncbi:hypothetical protein [Bordetella sp. BOR01]|uniref:hypothetical protein n=1 Tax=Bordetella sp. BOR01 TaxID=2854779 RepID=UPI001C463EFA|nr:hypothetical protein [Bordetella sp. BOR01]MBV7483228.1 hypothetical protein [Bordetella sp. BOR01]